MKYIAVVTLLLLGSCTRKTEDNNVLYIALSDNIPTIDPASSYDTISNTVVYQVYEQLYEYHYLKTPYMLQPLLAEDMPKVSEDGKTYTITIKKGVRYHDDPSFRNKPRFVKAEDFITQIKRLAFIPTGSSGKWLFSGKIVGFDEFSERARSDFEQFRSLTIEGLSAPDDHTLVIKLISPYPQLIYSLAMSFTSPMPMETVEFYSNIFNERMVGTGAFKLVEFSPSRGGRLVRFEHFHGQNYPSDGKRFLQDAGKSLPFIDTVELRVMKEEQTRWLNFRKKNVDILIVPKDNFQTAIALDGTVSEELKKEGIALEIAPTLTYWWISFNMNDPLLGKNLALRKAVAHAIDMDRYVSLFTNNTGQKANSIYPPGIFGYSPEKRLPYEYNVDKAHEFLKMAGFPEGKGLARLKFDTRGTSTSHRQRAEYIKAELKKVGIEIDVTLNTFAAFLEKARKGEVQIWQDGWAMDYPDAENNLLLLLKKNFPPGPNTTYYHNPEVETIFERLKVLPDGTEKKVLMDKAENLVNADLPWIMQYYDKQYILYQNRLRNYRPTGLISNYFKYLRIQD